MPALKPASKRALNEVTLRISFKARFDAGFNRSEEHTSELQSQSNLVCRLLLEKKKMLHATEATVPSLSPNPTNGAVAATPLAVAVHPPVVGTPASAARHVVAAGRSLEVRRPGG